MRSFASRAMAFLSWLALVLAFVPVLFPVVIGLAVFVWLSVAIAFRDGTGSSTGRGGSWKRILAGPGRPVLRRSAVAVVTSLVLYGLLWLHSQLFYVGPLKQDQEPFRKDAAEQLKDTGKRR